MEKLEALDGWDVRLGTRNIYIYIYIDIRLWNEKKTYIRMARDASLVFIDLGWSVPPRLGGLAWSGLG